MKKYSFPALAIALCLFGASAATEAAPAKKPVDFLQKSSLSPNTLTTPSIECSIMLTGKEPMSIRDGQRRLAALGYYQNALTDIQDQAMTEALQKFQKDFALEQTGELDEPTRTLLIQKTDPRYQ